MRMRRLICAFVVRIGQKKISSWQGSFIIGLSFYYQSSHVTRKPVFGVFHQVTLNPVCSTKEACYSHEIANIETRYIILPRQRTTKVLIRLRGCTGWSAPLLFAYGKTRFSHDVAQLLPPYLYPWILSTIDMQLPSICNSVTSQFNMRWLLWPCGSRHWLLY